MLRSILCSLLFTASLIVTPQLAFAQVAKGLVDINTASEAELIGLPHMTPALAKVVMDKRPFAGPQELHSVLTTASLTATQTTALYGKAFVNIDLNKASSVEMQLIPGVGKKMAHEFDEYRPWKSYAQFDKEIGKYVSKEDVARLRQYTFIPMSATTASDDMLSSIPLADAKLLDAIKKGRPYKTAEDVKKALVALGDKDAARVARYLVP